jgi:hypothetical protein
MMKMDTKIIIVAIISLIALTVSMGSAIQGYAQGVAYLGKPSGCNYDGSCQGWEDPTCSDCTGNTTTTIAITTTTIVSDACGDGYCAGEDLGEDCYKCPTDCPGKTTGKPSGRYCCGNYGCEIVGEDSTNCPIDCGTGTTTVVTTTTTTPITTTTIGYTCNDTDGGQIYTVKGTVSGKTTQTYSYTDYCITGNATTDTLVEYYCRQTGEPAPMSEQVTCSGLGYVNCTDGACV